MAEEAGQKPFSGQVALVTGASKGIGAATALALGEAGAHVILTARSAKGLETIEEAIHAAGGSATIAPMDLGEPDAIARLATAMAERWDVLDILVLSAAYLPLPGPVTQFEPKLFNQAITTNVLATQALLAAFDPMLKRSKDARIVGLTSAIVQHPRAYWGGYAATKAAFEVLLDCYWQEVERISKSASRSSIRARSAPICAPAPSRAKIRCR